MSNTTKVKIALVGCRNVGKSTLFNLIIGQRKAIVADIPGLTRDIIEFQMDKVKIMDTPGLDLHPEGQQSRELQIMEQDILRRTTLLVQSVDIIIFMVAYPSLQVYDHELASILRKSGKHVICVVNKVDSEKDLNNLAIFYELGFAELVPIAAKGRWNTALLYEKIEFICQRLLGHKEMAFPVHRIKKSTHKGRQQDEIAANPNLYHLAIIGKPNAGKSTLLNSLINEQRALVNDVAGTTRDSIDAMIGYQNKDLVLIDTAGIRKRGKRSADLVEMFSFERTEQALIRCDAVLHLIDANQGITDTDKKIVDLALAKGRQILVCFNKWDSLSTEQKQFDIYLKNQQRHFSPLIGLPVISVSGLEKMRLYKMLDKALDLIDRSREYCPTAKLNDLLDNISKQKRVVSTGAKIKLFYMTQVAISPPTFVVFVAKKESVKENTRKFIAKLIKDKLNMQNVVIRLIVKDRSS